MTVKKGLNSITGTSPSFSNNQVSNVINVCKLGFANASFLLAEVIDTNNVLTTSQKTDLKATINNVPFANIGRLLQDLDQHTEKLLDGSLGEETVAGSGERGDFLEHMQLVDSIESQVKNLRGVTASSLGKGVDDHYGTLRISVIDSSMQSLSTNIANIVDKSLAQETNYVTSCNNLRTFINTLVSDSTDFQTSLNNKATDVATKATAFDGAITAEPTLSFKNAINTAREFVQQQIEKEQNNLATLRTYSKSLVETQSYIGLAQNSLLNDLIAKSSDSPDWQDYFENYETRKKQFDPVLVSASDSSDAGVVAQKLKLKGLPDVTNYLDLKRVSDKAKKDVRLSGVKFDDKSVEDIITLSCTTLGIQTTGMTVYDLSSKLLDNMNNNDIEIVKADLKSSKDVNTVS